MSPRFSHETTLARSLSPGIHSLPPNPRDSQAGAGDLNSGLHICRTSDLSPEPSSLAPLPPRGSLYLLIPVYCLGCICIVRAHVKERNKTAEPRLRK